jgi:L-threonylcarbamoyladenylate synthase
VVLYPTETVWGLGGRAADPESAHRIAALKGRTGRPLIVMVAGPPAGLTGIAQVVAEALWPGPVTLIVPGDLLPDVAKRVRGRRGSVAIRHSPHPAVAALVAAVGPITSTSANRHGQPPVQDVGEFIPLVDAVLQGQTWGSRASTLVDGTTGEILRAGSADADVARILAALRPEG